MIDFTKSAITPNEILYLGRAVKTRSLSGDGFFTKKCNEYLSVILNTNNTLLTHSCTAALEMAMMLIDLKDGDEVIMPSYTFVSTANAVVLKGGVPVFIDIHPDTLNIDENLIEDAITSKTKAIVPVHYAGVSAEMDAIMHIASKYNLFVVEDAAQGLMSTYKRKALGTIGDFGAISFHATKNISCGEGGVFIANSSLLLEKAEIIREKGTNRSAFYRGAVDKYTWVSSGSSFLPSELNAAVLASQLECAKKITIERLRLWNLYHKLLESLELEGKIKRPFIPQDCAHNGHIYYILVENLAIRTMLMERLREEGIQTAFHYVPLHNSPFGLKHSRCGSSMKITESVSDRIVRLPIWFGMNNEVNIIVEQIEKFFHQT
jgi:dTDP-4-amino-4,6-dideoxygalactose transaminase